LDIPFDLIFFTNSKIFGDLNSTVFISLKSEKPNDADHMATNGPIKRKTEILKIVKISLENLININTRNNDVNPPKYPEAQPKLDKAPVKFFVPILDSERL
tara:strand:+ start:174 stop:476 length:303 start_codon:yes stop_codon:yes gene_type:complete